MSDPPIPPHIAEFARHLQTLPVQPPPLPWHHRATYAVGGLLAVGYAEDSDLLLVISSQGRGVFDCRSGTRVARDYADAYDIFDEIKLTAQGIGPLDGRTVRVAGLYGGGLPNSTRDGWSLHAFPTPWPQHSIVLAYPFKSVYQDTAYTVKVGVDDACELRTYGFSETGGSFIVALSCEIAIFAR